MFKCVYNYEIYMKEIAGISWKTNIIKKYTKQPVKIIWTCQSPEINQAWIGKEYIFFLWPRIYIMIGIEIKKIPDGFDNLDHFYG